MITAMTIRSIALAATISALLTLGAIVVALAQPGNSFGNDWPTVQSSPAPARAALARPVPSPSGVKAYAAAAYVHQANCQSALIGANGDNDVYAYVSNILSTGWTTYTRYSATRFVQYVDYYVGPTLDQPYNHWLLGQPGFCMGDDSNIVDKMGSPPAGW